MKVSKIIIIAFISILIMMSAAITSCGGNGESADAIPQDNKDVSMGEQESASADSGNSIEARPDYDLPEKDFIGYGFRILSRSEEVQHWWNYDIAAIEENGDPINDAIYQRNKKVEEKYNIEIKNVPDSDVAGKAARSVKSGSDDYDLVVTGLSSGQAPLITSGYLSDLRNTPHVDLTKPWWDQKAVEQLSIAGKLYATSCDLTVRDKDAIIILMFSKTLAKNYELEDLYQLVLSGKWTFDKMFDMMKKVSKDLNGDGQMGFDDQYGLLSQYRHSQYLFNAAGEYLSKLNADKIPEITLYNDRAVNVCGKITEMQGNKDITINAEQATGTFADIWDAFQVPLFAEDRALFYHAGMNRAALLRTMETDFGIIPPPKYDENQTNYYATVDAWCTSSVSVPITVENIEKIGLILETLAYESRYILLPAYYDVNLKTKFARDEESRAMIDIILNNRLYDLGEIYDWGSAGAFFGDISQGKGGSLTTYWDKNKNKIELAMQKTMEKLNTLD